MRVEPPNSNHRNKSRMASLRHRFSSVLAEDSSTRVLLTIVREKVGLDDITLRASALAYSTLASLVPIFALLLAVLSGPAFESRRGDYFNSLASHFIPADAAFFGADDPQYTAMIKQQTEFKRSFEETIAPIAKQVGAVSIFSFIALLLVVALLFQSIETSFNAIWRAPVKRSLFLRLSIATSLMFWGPIMLALSVSLSEYLTSLHLMGIYFLPGIVTSLAFAALYMIMPSVKVDFKSALIGGIVAALFWELAKLLFLLYVSKVVGYYHVYGSLGLVPMLFMWVYINWLIILYGAELAYVLQHRTAMVSQWVARRNAKASAELMLTAPASPIVVLAAAIEIARRFKERCPGGVRASQLASALHVETVVAQQAASQLVAAGVLARVVPGGDEALASDDPSYLPASEPQSCVVSALLSVAFNEKKVLGRGPAVDCARRLLAAASSGSSQPFGTMTLADLADEQRLLEGTATA